jgi:hypothetical protein
VFDKVAFVTFPKIHLGSLTLPSLAVFCLLAAAAGQAPGQLTPQTLQYVKYSQSVIAISHVRVIDGNGKPAQEDQTVILQDGKIESVGSGRQAPQGATVIDGTGYTLIPGLVGMHDHMYYPAPRVSAGAREALYPEHASSFPKLYLAGGVTTIRTTGSIEPYTDLELQGKCQDRKCTPLAHTSRARVRTRRTCIN